MKKYLLIFAMCVSGAAVFAQQAFAQQSLGDVARANRAKKHTSSSAIKLDDDTMPRSSTPSTSSEPETAKKTDDKSADADKEAAKKDAAAAKKQKNEDLKKQIDDEKKEIATLQRELDLSLIHI